jgi:hypothetical protein
MTARNAAIRDELVRERDRLRGRLDELALEEGMYAAGTADYRAWSEDTRFYEERWYTALHALACHLTAS